MILTSLSLQRVGHHTPHVPTNEERIRAYRAAAPVQMGNALPWRWTEGQRYAAEQMRDHPETFAGSYGDLTHGY